mmetsp:Transcript_10173/g.17092  ORF Transcript_10173/g.17092 Transcript_10173/m.17092 type:complete len:286 (+) Transcript_10173:38-895(+)
MVSHIDFDANPAPETTPQQGTFTFSVFTKYFIFAEALLLVFLLYFGNKQVKHKWFAFWCAEILVAIGIICVASGVSQEFWKDERSPLLKAILPATMTLATFGLWALIGTMLTPSSKAKCTAGYCELHPRWIPAIIGLILSIGNLVTAFAVDRPGPLISIYFAAPCLVTFVVVLILKLVVARSVDEKIAGISMLGGMLVILVGAIVLVVFHQAFECDVYTTASIGNDCPLPYYFDAEAVFMCFLAVGLVIVWVGALRFATEDRHGQSRLLADQVVGTPKNSSKYFR